MLPGGTEPQMFRATGALSTKLKLLRFGRLKKYKERVNIMVF
jgi:hypothetical protein